MYGSVLPWVFGWKIQKWEGPIDYWLVATGDTSTPVINGGLMPTGEDFLGTVNTIEVGDIDAAIAIVKAHDGTLTLAKNAILARITRHFSGIMLAYR